MNKDSMDFVHKCCFKPSEYKYIQDDLYVVDMESGKQALYKMSICDMSFYNGTGQHDWKFTFIRYLEDGELVETVSPVQLNKDITKYDYKLKELR
jgi:hypothetical protein